MLSLGCTDMVGEQITLRFLSNHSRSLAFHPNPVDPRFAAQSLQRRRRIHRRWISASSLICQSGSAVKEPLLSDLLERYPDSVIDVSELALQMRTDVRRYTQSTRYPVKLVGILANQGPYRADSELYSHSIQEMCKEDGIDYELFRCSGKEPAEVEAVIQRFNQRADVHGILVFYPIFKTSTLHRQTTKKQQQKKGLKYYLDRSTGVYYKTEDDYLRDVVSPHKDVEGLCRNYTARRVFRARGGLFRSIHDTYIPCTALAVLKILETYHKHPILENDDSAGCETKKYSSESLSVIDDNTKRWSGLTVTIVNRSEILGRPLAALLAIAGASVYSVDDTSILLFMSGGRMRRCPSTTTLQDCLQSSQIVVTGVPSPDFVLPSEHIAPGCTVVNVSEFSNVCVDSLLRRPNVKLIPSIGKVTCAALEQNLIRLHERATGVCDSRC